MLDEACKLIQLDFEYFEYVTEMNDAKSSAKEEALSQTLALIFYGFNKTHNVPEFNPCIRRHVWILKNLVKKRNSV